MADTCAKIDAHLIQISTDFIFNGENGPYTEEDNPNPLSYYGISKLRSEQLLQSHTVNINNFFITSIHGLKERIRFQTISD